MRPVFPRDGNHRFCRCPPAAPPSASPANLSPAPERLKGYAPRHSAARGTAREIPRRPPQPPGRASRPSPSPKPRVSSAGARVFRLPPDSARYHANARTRARHHESACASLGILRRDPPPRSFGHTLLIGNMATPFPEFVDGTGPRCHHEKSSESTRRTPISPDSVCCADGNDESHRQAQFLGRARLHADRAPAHVALWRKHALP